MFERGHLSIATPHDNTEKHILYIYSMPRAEFEPAIPMCERSKAVCAMNAR
jgi:hypothetical protein